MSRRSGAWKALGVTLMLVAAVLLALPQTARAQDASEQYTELLNEAAEVYKAGDLYQALLAYLEIRAKFSGPEVDYSLGRTYQRLYQCVDATNFYSSVMSNYGLPEDDALFSRSAGYYTELLNCEAWGTVEVTCSSPAAILYINDEMTGACLNRPYRMPEGRYTLKLVGEGTEPVSETVNVTDGARERVTLTLQEKVVERVVEVPVEVPGTGGGGGGEVNWLAWSLVGFGAASLTAAAYFNAAGFDAMVDVQAAADRGDSGARRSAEDDVSLNQLLTGVFFGLGLASAAGGATWLIIDAASDDGGSEDAAAGLRLELGAAPTSSGGGLLLQGTY